MNATVFYRIVLACGLCVPAILVASPQLRDATISPLSIPVGQPVSVTFSVQLQTDAGDPVFIPGSMNAFRVDENGKVIAALGSMRDDGTNGDNTAGDNIFTLQFTTKEAAAGNLRIMASGAFRGTLTRAMSIQAVVGIGGATPTIGVSGGVVRTTGGASLTIRPGTLNALTPITLMDASPASVSGILPSSYSFVGAVSVDLNGAVLATEADLAVPLTTGVTGRPIVARVISIATVQRLTLVDTASVGADGLLHTNSPPFPGVLASGTYAFVGMPPTLGIVGLTVLTAGGQPINGATVAVVPKNFGAPLNDSLTQQSLNSLSAFVGISGVDGSAFIPGAMAQTDVVATAILSPSTGEATFGAIDISLTDILSGGILGTLNDKLIVDKIYPNLPPQAPMCDCNILAIDPVSPFSPGENQQLKVACGDNDVTKSDAVDAATIVSTLLLGVSANQTFYRSSDSQKAAVSQVGVITAVAPGSVDISILSFSIKLAKVGNVPFPFICFAYGFTTVVVKQFPTVRLNPFGNQTGSVPYSVQVVDSTLTVTPAPANITVTLLREVFSECSGLLFSSNRTVVVSQGQSSATFNFDAGRDPACNTLPITTVYTVTNAVLAPSTVLNLGIIPSQQLTLYSNH